MITKKAASISVSKYNNEKYIIIAEVKAPPGLWRAISKTVGALNIDCTEKELGEMIFNMIELSQSYIYSAEEENMLPDPWTKPTGIKSWAAFAKKCEYVVISLREGKLALEIERWFRTKKGAFGGADNGDIAEIIHKELGIDVTKEFLQSLIREIEITTPAEELGKEVKYLLDLYPGM